MSEELAPEAIKESELLKRLERWTDKQPSRLEVEDFHQDITFNQTVESVRRLLGFIHGMKE